MINYWWVTRPKRKLNSVPDVLAKIADLALDQEWQGQRDAHLDFESALEDAKLKRTGERRDQTGGGARTYLAWIASLGLIFEQESTNQVKLTLAGEAIINGDSPVEVLKAQVLKYQFPSAFSLRRGVQVSPRFTIRPFRFLLRLLEDNRINGLSEEEMAKVIIVQAENESDACYENVVRKIMDFRSYGNGSLEEDFFEKYGPSKGSVNPDKPFDHLMAIANTMMNWLEYTQLAKRDPDDRRIRILDEKIDEVRQILSTTPPLIDRPHQQEYFQRKYGVDPKHKKDTRNLTGTSTITNKMIAERKIKHAFISLSLTMPVAKITLGIVEKIALQTGFEGGLVEETLLKAYPYGAVGSFMTEYFELAFRGRDNAIEFEKATAELFEKVFGFEARHIGGVGLTPDVLVLSNADGYSGIIDNKAYAKYTISNDHKNRMIHNYINGLGNYYSGDLPVKFFSYIAGGFGSNIDSQLKGIMTETGVGGSALSVTKMIKLVENHSIKPYTHRDIHDLLSVGRQIQLTDL